MNRTGQKIEQLYAWIGDDSDGHEAILAGIIDGETRFRLISSDWDTIHRLRSLAMHTATANGFKTWRLKRFTHHGTIEQNTVDTPEETT